MCKPQRKSSDRRIRSLLSCAIGPHHAPLQESVQLSSSWGERYAQLSLLWRKIFSHSGPTKRQSCKRMPQRKLNRPSTITVVMEPELFLLYAEEEEGDNLIVRLDKEKTRVTPAVVSTEDVTPRSYLLQTRQGDALRRNRRHLRFDNLPQPSAAAVAPPAVTGTVVEPPHSTGSPITKTAPSTHLLIRQ